ncbi:hypothetical protein [Halothermothrix orenii]|uniref:Peptidase S7, Flavivirus NS3 serine protease n=1 Tax=Halothermothrix orenii (strain H 168 / OCM 544 / DSM 9562) TaxID=373903 RepID=B8CW14_HALOH|nr:hypothetical protein [Halothermothrix orenii]ACL69483.1 Peptidase S7, Flavivirus NS3 serine protease [Halothermothrix orenii H 168]
MKVKGISRDIVNNLLERGNQLGQGRSVGTIGFVDNNGFITGCGKIVDGGVSGLPFRKLLRTVVGHSNGPLLELINQLPDNSVLISTSPGKSGIIISTGGINIFNLPVIKIGIKNKKAVGVGILYPESSFFNLATISERIQLDSLTARNMEEERKVMRKSTRLRLKYVDISDELPVVNKAGKTGLVPQNGDRSWSLPSYQVKSIDREFVNRLVEESVKVEQGREIASVGVVDKQGHVTQAGDIIVGGMGYVPSRLLASSYKDISDISLREAYTKIIPRNAVIVHTHPGGTGIMHMSDIMAGPGTWGRPIIAIGHNEKGEIKGLSVVTFSHKLSKLADEFEDLDQNFYQADTPEAEIRLRKRRYEIAKEFTDLCTSIIIK